MSSRLQIAGHLKENDFSLEIYDGFWIFLWRIIETTLLHSFSYGFLQSHNVFIHKYSENVSKIISYLEVDRWILDKWTDRLEVWNIDVNFSTKSSRSVQGRSGALVSTLVLNCTLRRTWAPLGAPDHPWPWEMADFFNIYQWNHENFLKTHC